MTANVRFETCADVGRLTLDRPQAINALDFDMIAACLAQLLRWATDDSVQLVLIDGAGERGLCAGGDVRQVTLSARSDGGELARRLWREEYRLNAVIKRYPKPVVSLMHGLVLGGGVGLSAHASTRVVTANSRIGMPEVTIGLVPDVGGSWLLAHAPGELGTHLALTAGMATAADAIACGLADVYLPSLSEVRAATSAQAVQHAIAAGADDAGTSPLLAERSWIDQCYQGDSASEIVSRLASSSEPAARATAELILSKSPSAVAVTLAGLRAVIGLDSLESALAQEYQLMSGRLQSPDPAEGVRAQLIDKDRQPRWQPASLAEVSAAEVTAHFHSRDPGELVLD